MSLFYPIQFFFFFLLLSSASKAEQALEVQVAAPEVEKPVKKKMNKEVKILPLITFFDGINGEVFNWWAENGTRDSMMQLSQKTIRNLIGDENVRWTYIDPHELAEHVSTETRKTVLTRTQMVEMAKQFGAQLIVTGDFYFSKSPVVPEGSRLKINLQTIRVQNGQQAAEVLRISDLTVRDVYRLFSHADTPAMAGFKDLHQQMENFQDAAKPSYLALQVSGALTFIELDKLKQQLRAKVPMIKSFKDNFFQNEQVSMLIEFEGENSKQLAQTLSQVQLDGFMTQVVSSDPGQVLFDVKRNKR